jgi:signal-transduction protein with cAMP-binding, CBS, and nucleotidyltransferase domain
VSDTLVPGYHHLPGMEKGQFAGVVTTSDLMLARQADLVYLVQHISRQNSIEVIQALISGMSNFLIEWVNSGIRAQKISLILTVISDAIAVRLIQLAEQLLGADQDNGLVIANTMMPEHRQWFTNMAVLVCDALHCIQSQSLAHQSQQLLQGLEVSNFLNPRDLPKLAKEQLCDAFTIIDEAQAAVKLVYRQGMG